MGQRIVNHQITVKVGGENTRMRLGIDLVVGTLTD